ncbi:MAG: 3-oxoacid CoA-transferase subunit B [Chloroflexi bacterium]|nr:3-oxoacid CoA-transferase subunit B [Chloroflexota bacterium]
MKQRLDRDIIAARAAKELKDGDVVNLGVGIGTLCVNFIPPEKQVVFHSENGVYAFGRVLAKGEEDLMDLNLVNAGGQFVTPAPGMSICTFADAFDAVRTGRIDVTVLGAFQVSEKGDLANVVASEVGWIGTIGGAMEMASGVKKVIVVMPHTTAEGKPKILKECTFPLTATRCVDLIVTDVAVIEVTEEGLLLKELAPGWTVNEVQAITEPKLIISPDLKEIEL